MRQVEDSGCKRDSYGVRREGSYEKVTTHKYWRCVCIWRQANLAKIP